MSLRERILTEIGNDGPMRFSRYMELCLYDIQEGFFHCTAPGPDGHFVTAPHVSSVFIDAIARAAEKARAGLSAQGRFEIVDVGAGDGTLLAGLARVTGAPATGVDRSQAARDAIEGRGLSSSETVPGRIEGFVICNELFDNLPFDLIDRDTSDAILIDSSGGELIATGDLARARPVLAEPAREMISSIARSVARGYVMIVDYCDMDEPVRGYRGQRPVHDVLETPGESDITGPVDLDALAVMASEAGLTVQARSTQRDLLHSLGYRQHLDELKALQDKARAAGDHATEISLWNARGEAAMLVDPQAMGAYGVLVLGTDGLPPLLD